MLNLVIPTYRPHFNFNIKFLKSFYKHCLDRDDVTINFIISDSEKKQFFELIDPFLDIMHIKIHTLKDIVKELFNENINEETLLTKIGKHNLQSLKKIAGVYKLSNPYSLLFDAETLVIRDFKVQSLFDTYFNKNRCIYYTNNNYGNFTGIHKQITEDCLTILQQKSGLPFYFFETYNWFFEKTILDDLFTEIELKNNCNMFDILTGKYEVIFETILYNLFIYFNKEKYNYKFICINDELHKIMGIEEYNKYKAHKDLPTAFEFHTKVLNNEYYYNVFKVFYNKHKLNFFKYGILNESQFSPYQIKFIEDTKCIIFLCTLWYVPELELNKLSKRII